MLIKVFNDIINPQNITSLYQRNGGEKHTEAYGVRIDFSGDDHIFIQGKNCDEVFAEINKQIAAKDSDVVVLSRSIMELSAICSGLCDRIEVLEKNK